jgi:hypothetical protein
VGYGVHCEPDQPCGQGTVNSSTESCITIIISSSSRMRVCFPPNANPSQGNYTYSFYDATNGNVQPNLCLTAGFDCVAVWSGGVLPPGFENLNPVSVTDAVVRRSGRSSGAVASSWGWLRARGRGLVAPCDAEALQDRPALGVDCLSGRSFRLGQGRERTKG